MDLLRVPSRNAVLACGLPKWSVLDPLTPKHEQVKAWREANYVRAARYRAGSDLVYGLAYEPGLEETQLEKTKGQRILSAGVCAATHPQLKGKTAMVAIELPGEDGPSAVLVIGLENGVVVLDQIVEPEDLSEVRQSFHTQVRTPDFQVFGSLSGDGQVHLPLELDDLVPAKGGAAGIVPLRATRGALILGSVVGVLAVAAIAAATYSSWQSNKLHLAAQAAMKRKSPENQYRLAVQQLLDTSVVPLSGALRAMRSGLADFPLVQAGWELERISCIKSGACDVLFKRVSGAGASIDDFRSKAPAGWEGIAAVDVDQLTFSIKLPFEQAKLERQKWPAATEFRERNLARWQTLAPTGWRSEMGKVALQGVPPTLNAQQIAQLRTMPEAVYAMPLSISNQPWWFVDHSDESPIAAHLLGPQTVLDGGVELNVARNNITFSAKGLTYVQR